VRAAATTEKKSKPNDREEEQLISNRRMRPFLLPSSRRGYELHTKTKAGMVLGRRQRTRQKKAKRRGGKRDRASSYRLAA